MSISKQEIDTIYDQFDNKDMTREDFHREMRDLFSPAKAASDLRGIMLDKQIRKARQFAASRRIRNGIR